MAIGLAVNEPAMFACAGKRRADTMADEWESGGPCSAALVGIRNDGVIGIFAAILQFRIVGPYAVKLAHWPAPRYHLTPRSYHYGGSRLNDQRRGAASAATTPSANRSDIASMV